MAGPKDDSLTVDDLFSALGIKTEEPKDVVPAGQIDVNTIHIDFSDSPSVKTEPAKPKRKSTDPDIAQQREAQLEEKRKRSREWQQELKRKQKEAEIQARSQAAVWASEQDTAQDTTLSQDIIPVKAHTIPNDTTNRPSFVNDTSLYGDIGSSRGSAESQQETPGARSARADVERAQAEAAKARAMRAEAERAQAEAAKRQAEAIRERRKESAANAEAFSSTGQASRNAVSQSTRPASSQSARIPDLRDIDAQRQRQSDSRSIAQHPREQEMRKPSQSEERQSERGRQRNNGRENERPRQQPKRQQQQPMQDQAPRAASSRSRSIPSNPVSKSQGFDQPRQQQSQPIQPQQQRPAQQKSMLKRPPREDREQPIHDDNSADPKDSPLGVVLIVIAVLCVLAATSLLTGLWDVSNL